MPAIASGATTGIESVCTVPLETSTRAGISVRSVTETLQHEHDRWMAEQPSFEVGAQQHEKETFPLTVHAYST